MTYRARAEPVRLVYGEQTVEAGCSRCGATVEFAATPFPAMLDALQAFMEQHGSCPFTDDETVRLPD